VTLYIRLIHFFYTKLIASADSQAELCFYLIIAVTIINNF